MSTSKQIALSVLLVAVAATVVVYQVRSGPDDGAGAEAGGHDMAAMSAGGGEMQPVLLNADAAQRIGVTFATVELRELPVVVRTVGNVVYDETRLSAVSPKIEGWVEELLVDFTGAPVRAGQPLMRVYSPALVTAQQELVLAARLVRDATVPATTPKRCSLPRAAAWTIGMFRRTKSDGSKKAECPPRRLRCWLPLQGSSSRRMWSKATASRRG